ncbi:hypothetical protein SPI_07296 [Niveomyces insectorum RCEF 264]|uniref:Uncharacterized protein n=1 Tax=Niveomyces insectorum RCEF 264 TaxID=1081102 RepID=A0A167QH43_9HYPO|nr:hypothetical protein SPI_07296 [Niveomyces insectorum RCEF 264]
MLARASSHPTEAAMRARQRKWSVASSHAHPSFFPRAFPVNPRDKAIQLAHARHDNISQVIQAIPLAYTYAAAPSGIPSGAAKSGRRVHFILSDNDGDENGSSNTRTRKISTPVAKLPNNVAQERVQRASSPPPQGKNLAEALPSEVEKFQGHFASVADRANQRTTASHAAQETRNPPVAQQGWVPTPSGNTPRIPTLTLLKRSETERVDVYSSPSTDAMAARFLEVDAEVSKLQAISTSQPSVRAEHSQEDKQVNATDGDKENVWAETVQSAEEEMEDDEEQGNVDDVQAVMDNLDDFLGIWNVDAELAQVRTGRV